MRHDSNGDYLDGKIDAERYVERYGIDAAGDEARHKRFEVGMGRSEDSKAYVAGFNVKVAQLARRLGREDVTDA